MRFNEYIHRDIVSFHSSVPSGSRPFSEHHHTQFEIALFLSGEGIYRMKTKQYSFQKGDIFLFSSNEIHCITEIFPDEPLELINLQFEPRLVWSNGGFADATLLRIFLSRNESFQNRIDRNHPAALAIRNDIMQIEQELMEEKHGYELMARFYLARILISLDREYNIVKKEEKTCRQDQTYMQLEKAMRYIDENLEKKLTLSELAHTAAMGKTYFSTVFKKLNGISPWDYITIKRVEKAVFYLQSSSSSKREIAGLCGFSSSSNFYKAFFKVTGKTPGDIKPVKDRPVK